MNREKRTMTATDFTATFTVDQSPQEVFKAINSVRAWWSGNIEGDTDSLGAEFTYRYQDIHYTKQKITEFVPNQRVVWHIEEAFLNFTEDPNEWVGTDVTFEITPNGGQTDVRFSHLGLVPEFECFEACSNAWGFYINGSLKSFITTGQGEPNAEENAEESAEDDPAQRTGE
jgi:uncharacterized protein YndB with AHSA1/START domain